MGASVGWPLGEALVAPNTGDSRGEVLLAKATPAVMTIRMEMIRLTQLRLSMSSTTPLPNGMRLCFPSRPVLAYNRPMPT